MAYKPIDWDGGFFGPNADYPYGAILDGTTRVNFKSRNDILMFAQKMMDEAGITPNSLPDNDTNGYQLFEALQMLYNPSFTNTGITFATIGGNTWSNQGAPYYNAEYKVDGNEIRLSGAVKVSALVVGQPNILTLPVGARPSSTARFSGSMLVGSTYSIIDMQVDTSGVLSMASSITSATIVFLDGKSFRLS